MCVFQRDETSRSRVINIYPSFHTVLQKPSFTPVFTPTSSVVWSQISVVKKRPHKLRLPLRLRCAKLQQPLGSQNVYLCGGVKILALDDDGNDPPPHDDHAVTDFTELSSISTGSTPSSTPAPTPSSKSSSFQASLQPRGLEQQKASPTKKSQERFKVQRRIAVGFIMGAVVTSLVFSSRLIFTVGMLGLSLTGLFEYYRMVAAKGHSPAYKMGLCLTVMIMLASTLAPDLADVVLPVGGTMICIYLLFRRSKIATIADISTTFMGLFYAGYLPSYWVRLHSFTPAPPDNIVASAIDRLWPSALFGFRPTVTIGSLLVFWTWLAAASADIGAFFIGRAFGRTRISSISPKKTVEGAVGGFLCSAGVSVLGAYLLRWPIWWATGSVYGVTVGVLGLCGDLFESCFKRDVGWKDSGSLFPGHGGMLDRADSYILVAPLVYFFSTLVLPWITRMVR